MTNKDFKWLQLRAKEEESPQQFHSRKETMFVRTLVSYSVEQKALIENNSTPMMLDATSFSLLIRVLICGKLLDYTYNSRHNLLCTILLLQY